MWRMRRFSYAVAAIAIAGAGAVLATGVSPRAASASPHAGQSVKVAMIGSSDIMSGGLLPESGPVGDLGDFTFTNLAPGSVSAASLAAFDTAVLNVHSAEINCNLSVLSASAETDLGTFVSGGGKLIIYDSECPAQNYGWLPFPFTTNNPGARGAQGTLTIAEENILASASVSSPHFIDAPNLGSHSDAVGDMNVMTTKDPNWCLSMSGTNVNNVTGPVHAYARHGSGLIMYNGLDMDTMGDESVPPFPNGLQKIWLQELQAPLHASQADLPCGVLVIGTPTAPMIVHSATPTRTATPLATNTPVPTKTSAQPTPPKPTATQPTSQVLGIVRAPNTGSGPGDAQMRLGWLLLAVAMLSGGAVLSTVALRARRR